MRQDRRHPHGSALAEAGGQHEPAAEHCALPVWHVRAVWRASRGLQSG